MQLRRSNTLSRFHSHSFSFSRVPFYLVCSFCRISGKSFLYCSAYFHYIFCIANCIGISWQCHHQYSSSNNNDSNRTNGSGKEQECCGCWRYFLPGIALNHVRCGGLNFISYAIMFKLIIQCTIYWYLQILDLFNCRWNWNFNTPEYSATVKVHSRTWIYPYSIFASINPGSTHTHIATKSTKKWKKKKNLSHTQISTAYVLNKHKKERYSMYIS